MQGLPLSGSPLRVGIGNAGELSLIKPDFSLYVATQGGSFSC